MDTAIAKIRRIALLGGGVMGETVLGSLVKAVPDGEVVLVEKRRQRAEGLAASHGVQALQAGEAVRGAQVVLLVVKPQDARAVLSEISDHLESGAVLVSLCAGVSTTTCESELPGGTPVVRVMPNTPARIGEGMSAVSPGAHATPEHVAMVCELLAATGEVIEVPEKQQDAVTAVSGSGPAYVFLVAEAMIDAAVTLGLPRDVATKLVTQTLVGGSALLAEPGSHPTLLREQVTSPGGTTAAALASLEHNALRAAFGDALAAARDRSVELGG